MVKSLRAYFLLALLAPLFLNAQLRVIKPVKVKSNETNIGFGLGIARSTLYLARNINSSNDALGFNSNITWDKGNYFRGNIEYSFYQSINIKPTWYNVSAHTIELNANIIAKSRDKGFYFYPISGISFNVFKGYFTGVNDYLNLNSIYQRYSTVTTLWWGLNAGVGVDFNFKRGCVYSSYRMRLGKVEGFNQFNIMDVFVNLGLRYYVSASKLGKIFRGTRSRYTLKTVESPQ